MALAPLAQTLVLTADGSIFSLLDPVTIPAGTIVLPPDPNPTLDNTLAGSTTVLAGDPAFAPTFAALEALFISLGAA
ncbi:hypothetical protein [Sphingomonas sp. TREG-RG-20F-R18-01]|uniref:hypothetical protein n=1 Tax=Sphingomonas sp. TREG-RG-20F-R18-01 TaxID=2914982 RepID=UPI001F59F3E5|nr:hypothetical protein [Sphingomonas sp. TREG-RG-20F-R18-01]